MHTRVGFNPAQNAVGGQVTSVGKVTCIDTAHRNRWRLLLIRAPERQRSVGGSSLRYSYLKIRFDEVRDSLACQYFWCFTAELWCKLIGERKQIALSSWQ